LQAIDEAHELALLEAEEEEREEALQRLAAVVASGGSPMPQILATLKTPHRPR